MVKVSAAGGYHNNTRLSPNIGSMLAHRLRRWPNIERALGERLVTVTPNLSDNPPSG